MSTHTDDLEKKKRAAFVYALGLARSVIGDALEGEFSREQAKRILDATAIQRIAESIGLGEADFQIDLEQLTEAEKHKIQGYDVA